MGKKEVTSVFDGGNGSGTATVPKGLLEQWDFLDEDGNVVGGPVIFEYEEDDDEEGARIVPIQ